MKRFGRLRRRMNSNTEFANAGMMSFDNESLKVGQGIWSQRGHAVLGVLTTLSIGDGNYRGRLPCKSGTNHSTRTCRSGQLPRVRPIDYICGQSPAVGSRYIVYFGDQMLSIRCRRMQQGLFKKSHHANLVTRFSADGLKNTYILGYSNMA